LRFLDPTFLWSKYGTASKCPVRKPFIKPLEGNVCWWKYLSRNKDDCTSAAPLEDGLFLMPGTAGTTSNRYLPLDRLNP